jgi:hypothetical protein
VPSEPLPTQNQPQKLIRFLTYDTFPVGNIGINVLHLPPYSAILKPVNLDIQRLHNICHKK